MVRLWRRFADWYFEPLQETHKPLPERSLRDQARWMRNSDRRYVLAMTIAGWLGALAAGPAMIAENWLWSLLIVALLFSTSMAFWGVREAGR